MKRVLKYNLIGKIKLHILHTGLRTNCKSMNSDLSLKCMTESPTCTCGIVENAYHYSMYAIAMILNVKIFLAVYNFIVKSRRFNY